MCEVRTGPREGEGFLTASVPTCLSRGRPELLSSASVPPYAHMKSQKSRRRPYLSLSTPARIMASQLAMSPSRLWSQPPCGFGWLFPELGTHGTQHLASALDVKAVKIWQSLLHSPSS